MDAVLIAQGCPERLRVDLGTENVSLAEMQRFLHFSEGQIEMVMVADITLSVRPVLDGLFR